MSAVPLVFLDTETTSLDRATRRAWEVALIIRDPDGRETAGSIFVKKNDIDLAHADPASLRIGRYHQRHPQEDGDPHALCLPEAGVARWVETNTRGAHLVGAVPSFDEETLALMLFRNNLCPSWHYHLVDVETLAAGALGVEPPWKSDDLLERFGVVVSEDDRHTALGDAIAVRDLYDAIMSGRTGNHS